MPAWNRHGTAAVRGLLLGSGVGALHALVLARAGLYATVEPLPLLVSVARYVAFGGLIALVFTVAGGLILAGLRRPLSSWIRGGFPGATLFLAAYLAAWALLQAREARVHRMPALLWAAGLGALALLLLLRALRALRHRSPEASLGRGRLGTGLALTVACGAILWLGAGGVHPSGPEPEAVPHTTPPPTIETATPEESRPKTHLLLLTYDTLRADHMGGYGYERPTTPAMDSLATSGVTFTNVLCQRPKTSPSFATIHTGTYPVTHGIHAPLQVLEPANLTLAEILRHEGWRTGAVITNGNLYPRFGFDQGFEDYLYGHSGAEAGADLALEWLEREATGEQPWFLWVHFTDPHWPYEPDPPFDEMFGRGSAETDPTQRFIDLYDGEIRYADRHSRRLFDWLHEHPAIRDRTLVAFTADHGESLGEHDYYWEHGLHPYEPSARIPLLLSLPGVLPPERVVEAMGGAIDLMPSLLELMGLPIPPGVQGRSLAALARGDTAQGPKEFVFLEAGYGSHIGPGRTQALRWPDRKYVLRLKDWALFPQGPLDLLWTMDACLEGALGPDEFYDLTLDPGETENLLFLRPEAPEARAALRRFVTGLASQARQARSVDRGGLDTATYESLKNLGYIE